MSCVSTFVSVATVDVVKVSSGQFPPVCGDKTGIFKQVMQKSTSSTSNLGTGLFPQTQLETVQTSRQKISRGSHLKHRLEQRLCLGSHLVEL